MKVRVLGCHGGETPTHRTTCFMIDDRITIDAGAVCRGLDLTAQRNIEHMLISHSHMDHVKDLALLADQVIGHRQSPIHLHCGRETAETLLGSYFNNFLWPDFTKIPTVENPVMQIHVQEAEQEFKFEIDGKKYEVVYIPVTHPVESMAMLIRGEGGSILYSSDTGPTTRLWEMANERDDLKGIFVELSFPNEMQALADVAGHFTPQMLGRELKKLDATRDIPLYIYHLKPSYYDKTKEELLELGLKNMRIIELGEEFSI